ncbi:MAG: hypothetical protein ACXVXT_06045 [Blastococcus sp.]
MTGPASAELRAALAPVRAALLARAHAAADAVLAEADADAEAALAEARQQAAALLADARARGERDAATADARERAHARREARTTVLGAQRAAYEDLRRRGHEAARALRTGPGYPALLAHLTARARAELGPTAVVREHPDGGVVAEAPGRRLDATLAALADRALDGLGPDVQGLWAP